MHEAHMVSHLPELYRHMSIQLAFWLNKSLTLNELLKNETHPLLKENLEHALVALGHRSFSLPSLEILSLSHVSLFFYLDSLLERTKALKLLEVIEKTANLFPAHEKQFDVLRVWGFLFTRNLDSAKEILDKYARECTEKYASPFFFLSGCFLAATNGFEAAMHHFERMHDYAYPPIYALLGHSLKTNPSLFKRWELQSFKWEQIELLRQEVLFFHCLGKRGKGYYFERKLKKTAIYSKVVAHE